VKSQIAEEFQSAVIDILIGKTIQAAYQFRPKSICLCGGVSANKKLREQMKKAVSGLPWRPSFHVPAIYLSTDNAAMIGLAAAYHLDQKTTWDKISADANLRI
jgi:N6-L-threonylcarbamoyladenine synthase